MNFELYLQAKIDQNKLRVIIEKNRLTTIFIIITNKYQNIFININSIKKYAGAPLKSPCLVIY